MRKTVSARLQVRLRARDRLLPFELYSAWQLAHRSITALRPIAPTMRIAGRPHSEFFDTTC
jgi:hypothetical protein